MLQLKKNKKDNEYICKSFDDVNNYTVKMDKLYAKIGKKDVIIIDLPSIDKSLNEESLYSNNNRKDEENYVTRYMLSFNTLIIYVTLDKINTKNVRNDLEFISEKCKNMLVLVNKIDDISTKFNKHFNFVKNKYPKINMLKYSAKEKTNIDVLFHIVKKHCEKINDITKKLKVAIDGKIPSIEIYDKYIEKVKKEKEIIENDKLKRKYNIISNSFFVICGIIITLEPLYILSVFSLFTCTNDCNLRNISLLIGIPLILFDGLMIFMFIFFWLFNNFDFVAPIENISYSNISMYKYGDIDSYLSENMNIPMIKIIPRSKNYINNYIDIDIEDMFNDFYENESNDNITINFIFCNKRNDDIIEEIVGFKNKSNINFNDENNRNNNVQGDFLLLQKDISFCHIDETVDFDKNNNVKGDVDFSKKDEMIEKDNNRIIVKDEISSNTRYFGVKYIKISEYYFGIYGQFKNTLTFIPCEKTIIKEVIFVEE